MTDNTPAVSNPNGRPKGSKNRITLLKLSMEEAVRSGRAEQINRILQGILDDAEAGDRDCRKMVWSAYMSKAGQEQREHSGELPQINLRIETPAVAIKQVETLDAEFTQVKEIESDGKAEH